MRRGLDRGRLLAFPAWLTSVYQQGVMATDALTVRPTAADRVAGSSYICTHAANWRHSSCCAWPDCLSERRRLPSVQAQPGGREDASVSYT